MPNTYFIADTHFDDDNIRRYENRPFDSVEAMNEAMIARWNSVVTEADTVWVLGDFGAAGREGEMLSRLKGEKMLVKGNHDKQSGEYYRRAGFVGVYNMPVIYNNFWILSHEPMYVCENMPYANLFGHVHANPIYRDFSSQHFCVSAERIDYTPVTLDTILCRIREN